MNGFLAVSNHDHRMALRGAEVLSVEDQVERDGEEECRGTGLGLEEGTDLGDGPGWQLLGSASSSSLPAPLLFPPPAPCPSSPSEFSSISWMRGGIEPGISIFSVITRSAPIRQSKSSCLRFKQGVASTFQPLLTTAKSLWMQRYFLSRRFTLKAFNYHAENDALCTAYQWGAEWQNSRDWKNVNKKISFSCSLWSGLKWLFQTFTICAGSLCCHTSECMCRCVSHPSHWYSWGQ